MSVFLSVCLQLFPRRLCCSDTGECFRVFFPSSPSSLPTRDGRTSDGEEEGNARVLWPMNCSSISPTCLFLLLFLLLLLLLKFLLSSFSSTPLFPSSSMLLPPMTGIIIGTHSSISYRRK